jgi:hypothetical protein
VLEEQLQPPPSKPVLVELAVDIMYGKSFDAPLRASFERVAVLLARHVPEAEMQVSFVRRLFAGSSRDVCVGRYDAIATRLVQKKQEQQQLTSPTGGSADVAKKEEGQMLVEVVRELCPYTRHVSVSTVERTSQMRKKCQSHPDVFAQGGSYVVRRTIDGSSVYGGNFRQDFEAAKRFAESVEFKALCDERRPEGGTGSCSSSNESSNESSSSSSSSTTGTGTGTSTSTSSGSKWSRRPAYYQKGPKKGTVYYYYYHPDLKSSGTKLRKFKSLRAGQKCWAIWDRTGGRPERNKFSTAADRKLVTMVHHLWRTGEYTWKDLLEKDKNCPEPLFIHSATSKILLPFKPFFFFFPSDKQHFPSSDDQEEELASTKLKDRYQAICNAEIRGRRGTEKIGAILKKYRTVAGYTGPDWLKYYVQENMLK